MKVVKLLSGFFQLVLERLCFVKRSLLLNWVVREMLGYHRPALTMINRRLIQSSALRHVKMEHMCVILTLLVQVSRFLMTLEGVDGAWVANSIILTLLLEHQAVVSIHLGYSKDASHTWLTQFRFTVCEDGPYFAFTGCWDEVFHESASCVEFLFLVWAGFLISKLRDLMFNVNCLFTWLQEGEPWVKYFRIQKLSNNSVH